MADFTDQNIQDTYQRVVQIDNGQLQNGTGSALPISFEGNNVIIPGALKAQSYIVSESIINVSSGSTVFGNSLDDTHTFNGAITASGGISSSGAILGSSISFQPGMFIRNDNVSTGAGNIFISDGIEVSGNITASGNINASRIFTGGRNITNVHSSIDIACAGGIDTDGAMSCTVFSNSSTTSLGGRVVIDGADSYVQTESYVSASQLISSGHITASGNISASGNIEASGFTANGNQILQFQDVTNPVVIRATVNGIETYQFGDDNTPNATMIAGSNIKLNAPVTSSIISASGEIVASIISASGEIAATTFAITGPVDPYTFVSQSGNTLNIGDLEQGDDALDIKLSTAGNTHIFEMGDSPNGFRMTGDTIELSGSVKVTGPNGNITASGNISASGNVIAKPSENGGFLLGNINALGTDNNQDDSTLQLGNNASWTKIRYGRGSSTMIPSHLFIGHITASGNISASGTVTGTTSSFGRGTFSDVILAQDFVKLNTNNKFIQGKETGGTSRNILGINSSDVIQVANANLKTDIKGTNIKLDAPVTASGNISASGHISASDGGAGYVVRPNLHFYCVNTTADISSNNNDTEEDIRPGVSQSATIISWGAVTSSHASTVFDLSSNELTIKRAGLYKFTHGVTLEIRNGSNRLESQVGLLKKPNGGSYAFVNGTETRGYHRFVATDINAASGPATGATHNYTGMVQVEANDTFKIVFACFNKSQQQRLRTLPAGTTWYIEAIT